MDDFLAAISASPSDALRLMPPAEAWTASAEALVSEALRRLATVDAAAAEAIGKETGMCYAAKRAAPEGAAPPAEAADDSSEEDEEDDDAVTSVASGEARARRNAAESFARKAATMHVAKFGTRYFSLSEKKDAETGFKSSVWKPCGYVFHTVRAVGV